MLVECQECAASISDAAEACPRCNASRDIFLGPPVGCAECGKPFFNAYGSCAECGAPRPIANPNGRTSLPRSSTKAVKPRVPVHTEAISSQTPARNKTPDTISPVAKLLPLAPLEAALRIFLWTYAVTNVILLVQSAGGFYFLVDAMQGRDISDFGRAFIEFTTQWSLPSLGLWLLTFTCAGFLYCRWIYRALRNLRTINAPGNETTPVMGVVWNFVPIGALYAPFMVMTELWRVTRGLVQMDQRLPMVFWIWWLLWLISGAAKIVAIGIDQVIARRETFDSSLVNPLIQSNLIWSLAAIASVFALFPIIRAITRAHDQGLGNRHVA